MRRLMLFVVAAVLPLAVIAEGPTKSELKQQVERVASELETLRGLIDGLPDDEPEPPPPPPGTHAYFDSLVQRADHYRSHAFRSQSEIDSQTAKTLGENEHNLRITYDAEQDAARWIVLPNQTSLSGAYQLHIKLPNHIHRGNSQSALLVWDCMWGPEWMTDRGPIDTQKAFRFDLRKPLTPETQAYSLEDRRFEIRCRYRQGVAPGVCRFDHRSYVLWGYDGATAGGTVGPQTGQFVVQPETWTRFYILWDFSNGEQRISTWAADVNRDPVLLLDSLKLDHPEPTATGFQIFRFEFNSSDSGRTGGELRGWFRNWVMLRDVSLDDVPGLLTRP